MRSSIGPWAVVLADGTGRFYGVLRESNANGFVTLYVKFAATLLINWTSFDIRFWIITSVFLLTECVLK